MREADGKERTSTSEKFVAVSVLAPLPDVSMNIVAAARRLISLDAVTSRNSLLFPLLDLFK